MTIFLKNEDLLPEAILVDNPSVLNYYLHEYVDLNILEQEPWTAQVHFMDFVIELTSILNTKNDQIDVKTVMPLSGEVFDARWRGDEIGICLVDAHSSKMKLVWMSVVEWTVLHDDMRQYLIDSLSKSGIDYRSLGDMERVNIDR